MNKKEIAVGQLRSGMYVANLDRPWVGTPFMFQGFLINSAAQIDELKRLCRTVFIEVGQEHVVSDDARLSVDEALASEWSTDSRLKLVPVEQELLVAKQVYSACADSIQSLLETLHVQGELDAKPLTSEVAGMAKSIERNPDAMMLLFRMK